MNLNFFKTPAIWQEPQNHPQDCLFCNINVTRMRFDEIPLLSYPNVSSYKQPMYEIPINQKVNNVDIANKNMDDETENDVVRIMYNIIYDVYMTVMRKLALNMTMMLI